MTWATVADLQARVSTVKSTAELQALLDSVKDDIQNDLETTFSSPTGKVARAHKFLSLAALLENMKTDGELPESNRMGDVQQINKIDKTIEYYQKLGNDAMKSYKMANSSSTATPYVISHVKYRECPSPDDEDTCDTGFLGR